MGRWHLVDEATAENLRAKGKKTIDLLKSTVVLGFTCGPLVACNPKGSMKVSCKPGDIGCDFTGEVVHLDEDMVDGVEQPNCTDGDMRDETVTK